MRNLPELVALSLLPFAVWREAAERLRAGTAPGEVLDALAAEQNDCDPPAVLRRRAASAVTRAGDSRLTPVAWSDPSYPPALAAIVDPPPVLWVRGCADALARPAVAIVGSRAGSPYALAVAGRLASDLSSRGLTIVSGLARGVDSAAHRGALDGRGVTVGVLGCGADIVYPREHASLAVEMAGSGALVSELAPGTPPKPFFFPRRNRIISGLSRAVVVIEAGERSGSLITARMALEQGREVLAVPGNVLTGRNRGAHALLRDGAKIVETADDILEELGPVSTGPASNVVAAPGGRGDPVLASMPAGDACDLDAIAERSGLSTARLLPRLFELEMRGLVRRAGGGRFIRLDKSC